MNAEEMTGSDVIRIAKLRGFKVVLNNGPPPMPILRDPGGSVKVNGKWVDRERPTPALLDALAAFRLEIIEELSHEQRVV